jgi:hypothetical protein
VAPDDGLVVGTSMGRRGHTAPLLHVKNRACFSDAPHAGRHLLPMQKTKKTAEASPIVRQILYLKALAVAKLMFMILFQVSL